MTPEQIQIHIEGRLVGITIQRSRRRRRTVALSVRNNNDVILMTPTGISAAELQRFALHKSAWILGKLKKFELEQPRSEPSQESAHYMGRKYSLKMGKSPLLRNGGFCEIHENTLHIYVPTNLSPKNEKSAARQVLACWYQKMAAEVFEARAKIYAAKLGVQYKSIKLMDPKTRWGSCDKHGKLMFSWRTIMLPLVLIDYLIVHELCHLVHFNHSKAYWHLVETILPDYKYRRKALRQSEILTHLRTLSDLVSE